MKALPYKDAAHLLRRMGLGGAPDEIRSFTGIKREVAVDRLIDYADIDNSEMENRLSAAFEFLHAASPDEIDDRNFNNTEIRLWWIGRLRYSKRPFEEKMTLFWHNFFATSLSTVPVLHMYTQNLNLRAFALARFDDLLLKVSQGAAMLIWLDGVSSTKTSPNENFARELQELFTMGTHDAVTGEPNYTENDVKEIARAFTGWRFRKSADPSPFAFEWFLAENEADFGPKTIYGQRANFTGEDVITLLADKRATGRYLVKRLFEFFVYPLDSAAADDRATMEKFADVYFANDHSIKELMRAIFKSDEFFSPRARFALVKNPVEFAIGAMKMLGTEPVFGTPDARNIEIEESLRGMGMDLFNPPDVFGWDLNLGFVANDTMLYRFNFTDLVTAGSPGMRTTGFFDVRVTNEHPNAKKTVKNFLNQFGPLELDKSTSLLLRHFLNINFAGQRVGWNISDVANNFIKLKSFMRLIMFLPEFQMN